MHFLPFAGELDAEHERSTEAAARLTRSFLSAACVANVLGVKSKDFTNTSSCQIHVFV